MRWLALTVLLLAQEPAPPPVPGAPGELVPFLVGTSHPEIPRPRVTPGEVRGLRARVIGYLYSPRRPGQHETRAFAQRVADVLESGRLGYVDAAYVVRQIQLILDSGPLDKPRIRRALDDFRGRLADTPMAEDDTRDFLRDARDVLASAFNRLP